MVNAIVTLLLFVVNTLSVPAGIFSKLAVIFVVMFL